MKHSTPTSALFAAAALALAASAPLASAADAYLESDGTQFMNTGYYVGPQTKIEFDYAIANWAPTADYYQMRLLDNNASNKGGLQATVYIAGNANDGGSLGIAMGDRTAGQSLAGVWTRSECTSGTKSEYCDSNRRTITIDEPNKLMSISENGEVVWASQRMTAATMTAIWPLGIFGRPTNAQGRSCDYPARIRVYGLKIYEAGELVRNYSPVMKSGVAGLLDSKTGTFLYDTRYNDYGTFATGGDIPTIDDDPYVESDGTSAINLGVVASPRLKIEVDFAMTEIDPGADNDYQQRIFGEDSDGNKPRISIYVNASRNIAIAAGDGWNAASTGLQANFDRHKAIIDNLALRNAYMTGVTTNWYGYGSTVADLTKCATRPLALFGNTNNDDGSAFNRLAKAKVYGCRIWFGGVLVRDLAPRCINGVAGFEDLVSGDFFTCAGLTASANAPTELAGPGADDDPYIESDGTTRSFFDTHYFPGKKTKIEVDYRQTKLAKGNDCVFGNYGSTFSILLYGTVDANTLVGTYVLCGKDGGYSRQELSPAVPVDLTRHTAVIDVPKKRMAMYAADGTLQGEGTMPSSWTHEVASASWPITLFASCENQYGTAAKQRVYTRIYGAKIWESDDDGATYTLVRDFKPMVQGGVAGFYDEVSGKFNAGEALKAGGKIAECDEPYIENNTTSKGSFETGLKITDKTKIVCDFMPLSATTQRFPFEAGDSVTATNGAKRMFMRTYGNGGGNYAYACGSQLFIPSSIPFRPYVRRELTLDAKDNRFVIGSPYGNAVQAMTIAAFDCPNESSSTLKIFSNGTASGNYLQGRLYGFKVYENGTLVGDYAPICQGGTYGLVDKVGGKVLAKASGSVALTGYTGNNALDESFFDAPMRAEDAYIESDGTQGINLGYLTTPNTRYEIDYQLNAIKGQNRPFGEATGNQSAELYIQGTATGSGNVAFGVGNSWKGQTTGVGADLNRHVAVLDLANRECGYSGYKMFPFSAETVCSRNATFPMWLFAKGTDASGAHDNRTAMKLYAFRIYEAGVLVHEYLPYKVGDVVGLYDTMTGDVITSTVSDSNDFILGGGLGYGKFAGNLTDLVVEPSDVIVGVHATKTLSAFAPGATGYVWTHNGEEIEGVTGETCPVTWEKVPGGDDTVIYGVTPVFTKGGETIYGATATVEATMAPAAFMMIVR